MEEDELLARLYPRLDDRDAILPRSWSTKDKYSLIGLSQANLRVHYKGAGKNEKDAASVRANRPIPSACGIYYFEVTVVSKGRDGYIGIGLSTQGVNLNRLPGWEKNSFGFHADDGHSFNQAGIGQPYGPTFATGDTVGCCVNLIENTCFFTKNGVALGLAFSDLPKNLYPTVGLQTPGEIVDTNFGQFPFVYDFEGLLQEYRRKGRLNIESYSMPMSEGVWHSTLQKIVSDYLIHHGYHRTADAFARLTGQNPEEDFSSIRNRRQIQNLVLEGQIGSAIRATRKFHPGLLEQNPRLLFLLRCRLFIEMVAGVDVVDDNADIATSPSSPVRRPARSDVEAMETTCSTTVNEAERNRHEVASPTVRRNSPRRFPIQRSPSQRSTSPEKTVKSPSALILGGGEASGRNQSRTSSQSSMNGSGPRNGVTCETEDGDDVVDGFDDAAVVSNGVTGLGGVEEDNGGGDSVNMEVDDAVGNEGSSTAVQAQQEHVAHQSKSGTLSQRLDPGDEASATKLSAVRASSLERLLQFGRDLQLLNSELKREHGPCPADEKLLQDAFSLLAYADPWSSPLGHILNPAEREPVADALNSAILESHQLSRQPPLELAIQQTRCCLRLMSRSGIASGAFVCVEDLT
ncbi:ran-binding protein 9-like isoform X2 [Oscarella lobularis]|uniref:ran-binding protein 9-like isoform X2 n=1 Tax=Oscarella lobularis TaxID=121494 RepID=UPI003313A81B